ncbi:MAG: chalcone isomerase family protein [Myxococcota bacterium]
MAACVASLLVADARAAEVAGVSLDDEIVVSGVPLVLNGAGLRTRFTLEVYMAAPNVTARTTSAGGVIDAAAARAPRHEARGGRGRDLGVVQRGDPPQRLARRARGARAETRRSGAGVSRDRRGGGGRRRRRRLLG